MIGNKHFYLLIGLVIAIFFAFFQLSTALNTNFNFFVREIKFHIKLRYFAIHKINLYMKSMQSNQSFRFFSYSFVKKVFVFLFFFGFWNDCRFADLYISFESNVKWSETVFHFSSIQWMRMQWKILNEQRK